MGSWSPRSAASSGMPGEVEQRQHARVAELELQGEPEHVEVADRGARLEREERQAALAQHGLEVGPGQEDPLAGDAGLVVEQVVEEPEPEVGHADLVGVREAEREADPRRGQVLLDGAELAADVAGRLLGAEDQVVERGGGGQRGAPGGVGHGSSGGGVEPPGARRGRRRPRGAAACRGAGVPRAVDAGRNLARHARPLRLGGRGRRATARIANGSRSPRGSPHAASSASTRAAGGPRRHQADQGLERGALALGLGLDPPVGEVADPAAQPEPPRRVGGRLRGRRRPGPARRPRGGPAPPPRSLLQQRQERRPRPPPSPRTRWPS